MQAINFVLLLNHWSDEIDTKSSVSVGLMLVVYDIVSSIGS